jgi:hypothetical protein
MPEQPPEMEGQIIADIDANEDAIEYKFDLTFYGADYPVDGLVKRLNNNDVIVPSFDPANDLVTDVEAFQRKFVWKKAQCDRFIESLLLGMPVPGIFLVQQGDKRLLVLDGQQRLLTLMAFYGGVLNKKEFALEYVQTKFKGLTYKGLDEGSRRTLDDSIIHATIIKKTQESDDLSSIYSLFERLNSGGTQLSPHEIRIALVSGPFMRLIRDLNEHPSWRNIFGSPSKSLKDQELILRFFALHSDAAAYKSPMKDFLTQFAKKNSSMDKDAGEALRATFEKTIDALYSALGSKVFRVSNALNAAVFDSVMVGLARRISNGVPIDPGKLVDAYEGLLKNEKYVAAIDKATAREGQVQDRLIEATKAFSEV